jgi:hypothetical protein
MPAWLLGLRFGGFFQTIDEVETNSALAARRSKWRGGRFGGAREKNETSLLCALSFFTRGRRFGTTRIAKAMEDSEFVPAEQRRKIRSHHGVVKACSVGSSERSIHDEESHWTPTIPIFGQLGNLRECDENRRSGRHSRLGGEIVSVHVLRRYPRTFLARGNDSKRNARRRKAVGRITTTW